MLELLFPVHLDVRARALVELGELLRDVGYDFVTVTPQTHQTLLTRDARPATSLRDIFGWNRTFDADLLSDDIMAAMSHADVLDATAEGYRSSVRFATRGDDIFVHSAFPTVHADSVFFGPDTYRFLSFIEREGVQAHHAVDVGAGSGAGGIVAARGAGMVTLTDINERALVYAQVNAALAGASNVEVARSDVLRGVDGEVDLVMANPPFMRDPLARSYRDGGGDHGEALSARITAESLARLSPGGRLLLYTGACVVDGLDTFLDAVAPHLDKVASVRYEELDPDIFGETLREAEYADAERIAAVGLVVVK